VRADRRGVSATHRRAAALLPPSDPTPSGMWAQEVPELDREHRGDRVQPELELGHDAEVAAPAPDPPEQIGVLVLGGPDDLAGCRDEFRREEVVACESMEPGSAGPSCPRPFRLGAGLTRQARDAPAASGDPNIRMAMSLSHG
jgi:hypothetical protein